MAENPQVMKEPPKTKWEKLFDFERTQKVNIIWKKLLA